MRDVFSRYKIVAFISRGSYATVIPRTIIARYFAPVELKIGVIRTDNGGEVQGALSLLLANVSIRHDGTPPYMTQYSGVAERNLCLLRDTTLCPAMRSDGGYEQNWKSQPTSWFRVEPSAFF